jgi:protein O-GlcNAc transferase
MYDQSLKDAFQMMINDGPASMIEACERLEKEYPGRAEHLFLLGIAAVVLDDLPAALDLFTRGHERAPDILEFTDSLASLNARLGNLSDSVYYAKLGLVAESHPVLAGMMPKELKEVGESFEHVGYARYAVDGWIAFHERRYDEAATLAQKEIALTGGSADAYFLLARAWAELNEYMAGVEAIKKAIEKDSDNVEQLAFFGDLLRQIGSSGEALEVYRETIRRNPTSLTAWNRLVCALAVAPGADWPAIKQAIEGVNGLLADKAPAARRKLRQPLTRIRVAYLVNEYAISKYASLLETAIVNRTEDEFRVNVYQQYSQPFSGDSLLRRAADDWRETFDIDDVTFAKIIENDQIDVLVDMCGFEVGHRQALLATKICPVQINWLGFPLLGAPATTDVVLDDDTVGMGEDLDGVAHHQMAGGMLCYAGGSVGIELTNRNESPFAQNGFIAFGASVEPSSLAANAAIWTEVLARLPNSALLFCGSGHVDDMTVRRIKSLFPPALAGRVQVLQPSVTATGRAEFLKAIDVYLDAHNSVDVDLVCDSLWMGAPVISLAGDRPSARLSATVLKAAGREDWIAADEAAFVDKVTALCADPQRLVDFRASLRSQIMASPLCDKAAFIARMESAIKMVCAEQLVA